MRIAVLAIALSSVVVSLALADPVTAAIKTQTNIAPQELSSALRVFAAGRRLQILYKTETVENRHTAGAVGEFTVDEALTQLLGGTDLVFQYIDEDTITIMPRGDRATSREVGGPLRGAGKVAGDEERSSFWSRLRLAQSDAASPSEGEGQGEDRNQEVVKQDDSTAGSKEEAIEEVVVTGTRIRGVAPDSSPLTVYDRKYIESTGVATVEQFARLLPQNLPSTDSAATGKGVSSPLNQSGTAYYGQAGINLHGLGPSSSLVLLNGRRVAPAGTTGDFVDISSIPLSAVERIDVLTDGASALYGADAIAGVVNFILRKKFDGAETAIRQGGATRGGAGQLGISQMFGRSWGGGSGLVVYEYDDQAGLFSDEREFVPSTAVPQSLMPELNSHNVFLTGHHDLPGSVGVSADLAYAEKRYLSDTNVAATTAELYRSTGNSTNHAATVSINRDFMKGWHGILTANYSRLDQDDQTDLITATSADLFYTLSNRTSVLQYDLQADGPLLSMWGRIVKVAVGASFRSEESSSDFSRLLGKQRMRRDVQSVYGELLIPLVHRGTTSRFAKRLEVSLAARRDDYGDIGSSDNPKIGLLWEPVLGLGFRSTYATSFRVPVFDQLHQVPAYLVFNLPDPNAPDGATLTLINTSLDGTLSPEESETFTVGIDIRPVFLPSFTLAATYFNTKFSSRIGVPPIPGGLRNLYFEESSLAPLINRTPNVVELRSIFDSGVVTNAGAAPSGADSIEAVFRSGLMNIASSSHSGVDLAASYSVDTQYGEIGTSASATYLLKLDHQALPSSKAVRFLSTVGQPIDLRLRGSISWTKGSMSSSLSINYSDGYKNNLFTPMQRVDAWTTADVYFSYERREQNVSPILRGLRLSVSMQNVTDEDPPLLDVPPSFFGTNLGFDVVNASGLGRVIALQASKRW